MRSCNQCVECCYVCAVPDLGKPAHEECAFAHNGCMIHGEASRPIICGAFRCLWLQGYGLPKDRPDQSRVLCTASKMEDGDWIFVIELAPDAVVTSGREMVTRLAQQASVPIIVVDYDEVPPNDRGRRTIMRDDMKPRGRQMIGPHIERLADGVGIYELA